VDDSEPKFGMVAIGEAHPDRIVTNAGARPGDSLVLTKPLGTGVLTTALKRDLISADELAPAVSAMTALNAGASRAMLEVGVSAATDVTGFGLLGHLNSLLRASGVAARVRAAAIPWLPGAREAAERGAIPGGTKRNRASVAAAVTFGDRVPEVVRVLSCDAQTSGGLLIAVPARRTAELTAALTREGAAGAVIGCVEAGVPGSVTVE
jgi:selenide,water dikinase